jgi:hypothetical protein
MDDPVVSAWPATRDGLRKDRPAAIEAVTERLLQGLEVLEREGLKLQQLLHVPKAERELPISKLNDLLGDVRLQDPPAIHGPSFPMVFVVPVVFVIVIHLGIRRRQLLEYQVLRLKSFIQEI